MRRSLILPAALFLAAMVAGPARAVVVPGNAAPDFTKNQLDYPSIGQVTPRSLADYTGKVLVFFLLGYD